MVQLGQLYRHVVRHLLLPVVEDQEPGLGDGDPLRPVEVGVAGEGGVQIRDVEEEAQGHVGVEDGLVFIQIHPGINEERQVVLHPQADGVFFVKHFSLKKASEFLSFSKGFSLFPAGIMHPCA